MDEQQSWYFSPVPHGSTQFFVAVPRSYPLVFTGWHGCCKRKRLLLRVLSFTFVDKRVCLSQFSLALSSSNSIKLGLKLSLKTLKSMWCTRERKKLIDAYFQCLDTRIAIIRHTVNSKQLMLTAATTR